MWAARWWVLGEPMSDKCPFDYGRSRKGHDWQGYKSTKRRSDDKYLKELKVNKVRDDMIVSPGFIC